MAFVLIYITNKDMEEAKEIVHHLLEKKLVACGNMFPIKSAYWWKRKIENDDEVVAIVKTREENWEKVKGEVKKMHSYDCPCIMKINVEANDEYEEWIQSETGHD